MSGGNSDWHNITAGQLGICYRALAHFGHDAQALKVFEEHGEFIQAFAKAEAIPSPENREALAGEIADSFVMLVQAARMHGVEAQVAEKVQAKLDRLAARIANRRAKA